MKRPDASRSTVIGVFIAVLLFAFCAAVPAVSGATVVFPQSIRATAIPQTLPTSNGTSFADIVVTLIGSTGAPTVALNNTVVYLASSVTQVLVVKPSVTIVAGHEYAIANVTTTPASGSSMVTVLAPGYNQGSVLITTVVPRGYPALLELTALPSMAVPGTIGNLAVSVLDQTGAPAQTVGATAVTITSSEPEAVSITSPTVTIPKGSDIGYGTYNAVVSAGSAILTASSPGFTSASTVVTNYVNMTSPDQFIPQQPQLQLDFIQSGLPADGNTYSALSVSLTYQTNPGYVCPQESGVTPPICPYIAASPVTVLLTSSFQDIIQLPGSVIIPQGNSSVTVPVTTTVSAGASNITASASYFKPATIVMNTIAIPSVKLGLYPAESQMVISPINHHVDVVVQLQDAFGMPVRARAPMPVMLSFSNSSMAGFPINATIPVGSNIVQFNVNLTGAAKGNFGVISQGLVAASADFAASEVPLALSLATPLTTIYTNETATVTFASTFNAEPYPGLALSWSATGGTLSNSSTVTNAAGSSSVNLKPSGAGTMKVIVSGNSSVAGPIIKTMYIQVIQAVPKAHPSILQLLMKYIIFIVPAAGGGAAAAFFLIRRRRKGKADSEEEEQ